MSKTSKQSQTAEIDPQMRLNSRALMGLGHMAVPLMDPNVRQYRGATLAEFTPAQKAAMESTNAAATAFGGTPVDVQGGMPTGAEESAYGIRGFAPRTVQEAGTDPDQQAAYDRLYGRFSRAAATPTPFMMPLSSGGGGKK